MEKRDIIVIGASAGGFEAIKKLIAGFSDDMDASIFIVWHMSPDVRSILPQVLSRYQTLPVAHAVDKEPIKSGQIYVARPDHHLLIENNQIRISRGPKENRFRPAVDPLFRSAAYAYGKRVIGIILSGALDDGSAGLWTIKQYGGMAIVQDPLDADVSSMPENAMRAVRPDHVLPVADMPALLNELVKEAVASGNGLSKEKDQKTKYEIDMAMKVEDLKPPDMPYGELTRYTCPECHGVLSALKEGGHIRFRCHTGHAFSADSLLATISEGIEESLWNSIRFIQESVMLLNHMGDHFAELNQRKLAAMYFKKAKDAEQRAALLRQAVSAHEQLTAERIEEEAKSVEPEK